MGKRGPKKGHGGRPILYPNSTYHAVKRALDAAYRQRKREASK